MSTYSVYNIHIDNNLSFTPGATAGSVLAIDANGSTSWVPQSGGSGGSQTLEQTLALGNSAGTYSIVATSSSNLTRTEMNFMGNNLDFSGFQDNFYLVNRENKVGNHNFSRIILGTSSMRLEFVDVEYGLPAYSGIQVEKDLLNVTNQKEIRLNTINSNIVLSDNSVDIFNNGATAAVFNSSGVRLPSITNSLLATNSLGQIIATSSTDGDSQTLEQTLALGNNVGTYSITGQGTPGIGVLKMPSSLSPHLATKLYQSKEPFNDFSFVMLSPGVTFSGIEINSDTLNIISSNSTTMSGIYMSSDNIRLRGLSGTGSNILSIDSLGNIGITSSISGGSGTSGTSGSSGTSGISITGPMGPTGPAGSGGGTQSGSFGIVIDGGGSAITTTGVSGFVSIPYSGTIVSWTIIAEAIGGSPSCVVDVQKTTYSGLGVGSPAFIAGTEKPTITSGNYVSDFLSKNEDNTLSTWTTSVSAGDIIIFNLDSVSNTKRITLSIKINKS